jgi:hypothetical protein
MEKQRGPRGLRDREYPDDVQGHMVGEPVEGGEQTANEPVEGEAPDEVEGHLLRPFETIDERTDGRER